MKNTIYFLLLCFFSSCQNATKKMDTTTKNDTDSISNPHLGTTKITSTTSTPISFNTMPLLATYINELPFYNSEFPLKKAENRLVLRADTIYFLEEEKDGDYSYYYQLNQFTQQQAQFSGGWYGTSGQQDWKATYQLLNDNKEAPIVLLAVQSKDFFGGYQETIEGNYTELKEMIEEGNTSIDEDDIDDIAQSMANMSRNIRSLDGNYHIHELRFWVWQKQETQWENITSKVFQPEMYAKLETAFPFLEQNKVEEAPIPGFFLQEKIYSEEGLTENKTNWKHWLGVEELTEVNFNLSINSQAILFETSKNKAIRWDWNGEQFTLNNLPKPIAWKDEPCAIIDYSSNKKYTFIGDITDIPIQMEVSLNNGKILGNYWYTNKPNSKFSIKGDFEASTEASLNFYRMKNNQKREWFHAYFTNCQFKGWWQHQETMATKEFTLKLVQ